MKRFEKAIVPPSEIRRVFDEYMKGWQEGNPMLRELTDKAGVKTVDEAARFFTDTLRRSHEGVQHWRNDVYQVAVREQGTGVHLSIKRIDRQPIHDWRDLQEIKNQLLGPECEAVELYPAESRRVDSANQYHLWGFANPNFKFPLGFDTRIVSDDNAGGSVNRPFGVEC